MKKRTAQISNNQQTSNHHTWSRALQWVAANRKLIRNIAQPYIRFMASDPEDLYQEAAIAAYKALITVRKKEKPTQLIQFFRVIFTTHCIHMASGVQTVHCLEDYFIPCRESMERLQEPKPEVIHRALKVVTTRQREVCLWLLKQPLPVSTPEIARKFNVSRRHACRLVRSSVQRISGAHS